MIQLSAGWFEVTGSSLIHTALLWLCSSLALSGFLSLKIITLVFFPFFFFLGSPPPLPCFYLELKYRTTIESHFWNALSSRAVSGH